MGSRDPINQAPIVCNKVLEQQNYLPKLCFVSCTHVY